MDMFERMILFAGGTCGSEITPLYHRYSSLHTTSLGVVRGDQAFVIDNGSGVRRVANWVQQKHVKEWAMLQTHFHQDHVEGFARNSLLFDKTIPMLGMFSQSWRQMLQTWDEAFSRSRWPLRPSDLGIPTPAMSESTPDGVTSAHLYHPNDCLGYRIASEKGDIVIATDHEAGGCYGEDQSYADFVDGAAVLVADIQYSQSEYDGITGIGHIPAMSKKGWGHSTPELIRDALELCVNPPKKILITHHDPQRPEVDFLFFLQNARKVLADVCKDVSLLTDGQELSL